MNQSVLKKLDWLLLPLAGVICCLFLWHSIAGKKVFTLKASLDDTRAAVLASGDNGEAKWNAIKSCLMTRDVEAIKELPNGPELWAAIEPSLVEKRVGLVKDLPNVKETWLASK